MLQLTGGRLMHKYKLVPLLAAFLMLKTRYCAEPFDVNLWTMLPTFRPKSPSHKVEDRWMLDRER